MSKPTSEFLNQIYQGYQSTSLLWSENKVGQLHQFSPLRTEVPFSSENSKHLRLGKWVEAFVSHQIKHSKGCQIIAENLQILKRKQTIGELDLLFLFQSQPIHLEIVYKFYLYDNLMSYSNPLGYWIGPNRRDTLVQKLNKLKQKQLPLLHHPITANYLNELHFTASDFKQKVCFKGQLFIPLKNNPNTILELNRKCISGFYISIADIAALAAFEFYIPTKLEWLISPILQVEWMSYKNARQLIGEHCNSKQSPMVWLRDPEMKLTKAFITFW